MNNRVNNRLVNRLNNTTKSNNNIIKKILLLLTISLVVYVLLFLIKKYFLNKYISINTSPYLIETSKNAKNSMVVTQDPNNPSSKILLRSNGEEGAEFSYSLWMLIDNLEYNKDKAKHIFHKGDKNANPTKAPGVWILPNENTLRIYMNTIDKINEYVDIPNIPIKKWIHLTIILNDKYLDIYFNGELRKRHELTGLPRQNYGNVWINLFGGFDGYLSKFRYFNYALSYKEIGEIVKEGPSKGLCGDTGDYPPYLDDNWWFDV